MSWIRCAISGRRWAAPMRPFLRTCVACNGLIDTRMNAWLEVDGSLAQHWPGTCATPKPVP